MTLRLLAIFGALLVMSGPALASSVAGTIKGVVVDDGGIAIPGTLITVSSPGLIGGAQQRTADDNGEFLYAELAPGRYELQAQKQGFGPVKKTGIEVVIGRTTNISIEMKYGGETVVVEGERKTIDTESVVKGTTFTKDYLSRIPSGRSYQGVVESTAGIALSDGGNPLSGGAAGNENTFLLDGVNVTDPVTGTFGANFNFDAIDEIQVLTGAYDPEYGESLGATISIVTSSGGNTMKFAARGDYTNGNWGPKTDGRYAADGTPISPTAYDQSFQSATVEGLVSGPIIRDRVWFLGAYQYNRFLQRQIGVDLPRDFDGHYFFGKLTAQPSSAHRFTLEFNADPTAIDNVDGGTFTRPDARLRQYQSGWTNSLKWNWFVNPEANLETILSVTHGAFKVTQVPCTHDETLGYNACSADEASNTIDFTTPGRVGINGAYASENAEYFVFDQRWSAQAQTKFSVLQVEFFGKHDIKAGIDGRYMSWDNLFGYPGNLLFADVYTNAFDPQTYQNYYWLETSGYSAYAASGYHTGVFLQDVYKPIENLTFRYGMRYDRSIMRNDADEPIVDVGLFGPRIYAIWDPWADEKTKIAGGYGRFNDTARLEIASYLSQSGYGLHYFYGEYQFGNYTSADQYNAYDANTDNPVTLADNTTAPHSDEFTLSAERELVPDLKAGLTFTGKFTRNIYTLDETNLIFDEDGFSYIGSYRGASDAYSRLRTPAIARRDYYQVDLNISRQFADRWLLNAIGSYISSRGTTQYGLSSGLSNPSQVELMYGNLATDINWQGKFAAAWDIPDDPWKTTLGVNAYIFSGGPLSRYYYSGSANSTGYDYDLLKESAGTYGRSNTQWNVDVRIAQEIPVDKGNLTAVAEISNITNSQYPAGQYQYYIDAQDRIVLYNRRDPIAFDLALAYEF